VAERLGQAAEKALLIERLTAANRAYREMLAFVSHELKNPLAGLVMEGRLLLEGYVGTLPPAQEERVRRIVGRAEYLVSLVRDYLDLAVIEGAELRLRLKRGVDVAADIVKPAVDLVEADFGESGMRLQVQAPREPARVDGDTELLKIVLVNLLGNAAKYGKRGGEARLTVGRTGTGVTLRVWNEGAGFREADRQDLFRRFTRLPTPEFSRVKGTGLGLYTAWRIVQMHQGRIGAASEYGKWAEFTVELPPAQGN
jgi:signal transduction histidine kinase